MGSYKNKIILVIIGAVALHLIFAVIFVLIKSSSYTENQRKITELKEQYQRDDDMRKIEQEQQLTEKYGTTKLDRIAFDPRLDIEQTLNKMLYEILPSQFETKVTVDNFTDFYILIKAMNLPDRAVLADYLQEVFSRVDPRFVAQVVMTDGDRYYIIDRNQLTSLRNWNSADRADIYRCCLSQ